MNWEDTVMNDTSMRMQIPSTLWGFRFGHVDVKSKLVEQAEISFKAGEEEGYFRGFDNGERQGKLIGIREVIEFYKKENPCTYDSTPMPFPECVGRDVKNAWYVGYEKCKQDFITKLEEL